jgi:hypothetical protein
MRPVAAVLLATFLTLGCSPPAPLTGAWRSDIHFTTGAFAAVKDLQFLYVFNAGGTMTESSNYDGAPPVPPAYGVWREVGPTEFELKYIFYVTKPPARFDEIKSGGGWMPAGSGVFTERIRVAPDGRSFESDVTYAAFDSAGKPAPGGGEGKAHGVRFSF